MDDRVSRKSIRIPSDYIDYRISSASNVTRRALDLAFVRTPLRVADQLRILYTRMCLLSRPFNLPREGDLRDK